MDLTEIHFLENEEQKPIYSFLSITWAIVADADINSEVVRWIGPARFTLWGVYRIIFKK